METLGKYIVQSDERNSDNLYDVTDVRGVSINKTIIATKANMDGVPLTSYKLFKPNEFCYVPVTSRNGNKITLAINDTDKTYIVSATYEVFRVKDTSVLLPDFLFLWFCRPEFDRYARFHSWGSAREGFSFDSMSRVEIPLPEPRIQQEIVNVWKSLRQVKEENEALAAPLFQLCQSKIQELKHSLEAVEISPYIEATDERNSSLTIKLSQGISNLKEFQNPKQVAQNSRSDKIVRTGWFAYNRATTRNGEKISIAFREGPDCTVSSAYQTFVIKDEKKLNPYFLWMWFKRPEFDRYARYMSKGSAHEFFEFEEMQRVRIPLPDIDVQDAIVEIFNCAKKAQRLAEEADKLSREICPALMQKVINS